MRAPLAPIGCPRATAPPLGFVRSSGRPSSRFTATACAANASFNSKRATRSSGQDSRSSRARTAGTGLIITHSGATPEIAWPTTRPSRRSPSRVTAASEATTRAAAPSFIPGAFPAVTRPSSRKTGRSAASRSSEMSGRTASSWRTTEVSFRRRTSTGTISASNSPASIARAARRWLSAAAASISSRLTPYRSATRSAVSPMWIPEKASVRPSRRRASSTGASPSREPPRSARSRWGEFDMDSMPPATTTSASPARIACRASITALRPEPQTLFTVNAPTVSGRPAPRAAWRAGFCPAPAVRTWPRTTSSTSFGSAPARATASFTTRAPSSVAGSGASAPRNRPTGVRAAEQSHTGGAAAEAAAVADMEEEGGRRRGSGSARGNGVSRPGRSPARPARERPAAPPPALPGGDRRESASRGRPPGAEAAPPAGGRRPGAPGRAASAPGPAPRPPSGHGRGG